MERTKEGYHKLASFISAHPRMSIYRRFRELNALNALYLQAELVDLEDLLKDCAVSDMKSDNGDAKEYSRDWFMLSRPIDIQSQHNTYNPQWRTMLNVREKLKEYNDLLVQQHWLNNFEAPNLADLETLKLWLERPNMGDCWLRGLDKNVWDTSTDLIALNPRAQDDPCSRWLSGGFIRFYHRVVGRKTKRELDLEPGLFEYNDKKLLKAADIIGAFLSSLLPISSLVILYFVSNLLIRLGIVTAFTILFSLALLLVTRARRVEVFAATAAFASVQVVFVGSTNSAGI